MISTPYKTYDFIPVRHNSILIADEAAYYRLILLDLLVEVILFMCNTKKTVSPKLAQAKSSDLVYCKKYERILRL